MAIAEAYSGTQAVDNATEWSMTTDTAGPDTATADGVYQIFIDTNDMVTGDQLLICVYETIATGVQRVVYRSILYGVQPTPIWVSPTLVLTDGWDATLLMLSATTATLDWSIRAVT
jgi:hypothetical protein